MTEPKPTDRPLRWEETRDDNGNSTFRALSHTYGNDAGEPIHEWGIRCVLRDNEAQWKVFSSPPVAFSVETTNTYTITETQEFCQSIENELREQLNITDALPKREIEPAPIITDEHGMAPTSKVVPLFNRDETDIKMMRVWKSPTTGAEEQREITDPAEEDACLAGFARQLMIEELVTRLATGGFGRLLLESPFWTVMMQAELEFSHVSAFTITIRRNGGFREIPVSLPKVNDIMRVVAIQMSARQRALEERIANTDAAQLIGEIQRLSAELGLPCDAPSPEVLADDEAGGVIPIQLEDIEAAGGNIARPGQLPPGAMQ